MNKASLPLIFKQEGAPSEAAGQEEENEVARLASPLMFSFLDREEGAQANSIVIRVGSGQHPEGKTTWCKNFFVQPGTRVRKLRVIPKDNRAVEWVYIIGIEVSRLLRSIRWTLGRVKPSRVFKKSDGRG